MPRKITCHRVVLSFEANSAHRLRPAKELVEQLLEEVSHQLRDVGFEDIELRISPDCDDADITDDYTNE